MSVITIYHNPSCSKSRETLDILLARKKSPRIKLYLTEKILFEELLDIIIKLNIKLRDLLRTSEVEYKAHHLDDINLTDYEIIQFMIKFPKLIQRPIVVYKDNAILGRPPKNVLNII